MRTLSFPEKGKLSWEEDKSAKAATGVRKKEKYVAGVG